MLTLHPRPGIELLVVEVPEDANRWMIVNDEEPMLFRYWTCEEDHCIGNYALPEGEWESVATTRDTTEEQAMELVEGYAGNYFDYEGSNDTWASAINSLKSLVRSKGGETGKHNYAILKREK